MKIIVLLIFLSIGYSYAQVRNIRFDNYTIEDGLSQSSVNTILQDDIGFIWVGTQDGLNRFDGYEFKVFKHDAENAQSLSNSYVRCLAQDENGLIWIGTETGGLNFFNPRTNHFSQLANGELLKGTIQCLHTVDENLYVGTKEKGLARYNLTDSSFHYFTEQDGLYSMQIKVVATDKKGNLFVGTDGNGLFVKKHGEDNFENYISSIEATSIAGNFINDIEVDTKGNVWIGTENGLSRYSKGIFSTLSKKDGLSDNNVQIVFADTNNTIWCGYSGSGLDQIYLGNPLRINNHRHNDFNPTNLLSNIIYEITKDQSGTIWIGSNGGVSKFDPLKQAFEHFKSDYADKGLIDKNIWCIYKETDNIIWVGTRGGISRLNRLTSKVNNYPFKGDNPYARNNNSVNYILKDREGRMWGATISGLKLLEINSDYSALKYVDIPFSENQEGQDNRVYQIAEQDDYLWLACRKGLARIHKETKEYRFFQKSDTTASKLSDNVCRTVFLDSRNNIWVGTNSGGLNKITVSMLPDSTEHFRFTHFKHNDDNPNSISSDVVMSLWEAKTGDLWIGTYGGGLNKYDPVTKQFSSFTEKNGLSNNSVYGVIGGEEGTLWLTTNQGASLFNMNSEVFRNFYASDGLQSNEFNTGAFHHSSNGELFIGGINGFNAFYPANIKINEIAPRVGITDVLLFNETIEPSQDGSLKESAPYARTLFLDYDQNNITIKYTALHFTSPQGNQYKYILTNNEENYNEVGNNREAHYTNLSPGNYTFEVYACNSDGVWTEQPAILNIIISPPFWATWWFIMVLVLIGALIAFAIFRWRVRSINAQKEKLANLVEQRTRTVTLQKEKIEEQKAVLERQKALAEEEKAKADKLLTNILPVETAEELKNKGKTRTRTYRRVTVMFTDFEGFTKIAEKTKPQELVKKLDTYFRKFDEIVEANHIEKIKTIGDSYMAAGGVPLRDKENPINTTIAAIQIQQYVQEMKKQSENPEEAWSVRIGIHTGEVIAGVIGTKRIAYDIWGNTVNVAARMESSGDIDKVNVSGKTFEHIEPYFDCTYRGKIAAKNKGHVDMYFVDRIKPHLSENGEGVIPNKRFWEYLNLHVYSAINYRKAERHIMRILGNKLSPKLYYHGIHHTHDVVQAAERLAILEGVVDEDIFVLKSAATYHDAGFVEQYDANEPIGAQMAAEILPKYGYTEDQVEQVFKLIYATRIPHNPQSKLEEIICDADLDYLGRDDFHDIADTLRLELREHGKINSDRLWDEIQVKFLTQHKYFTDSAKKLRQAKKEEHLNQIKERLKLNNYKD